MHLCAELTAAFWTLEPFGEIRANFSLQLSSRTQFEKNNKKNKSPKINVKNIKIEFNIHLVIKKISSRTILCANDDIINFETRSVTSIDSFAVLYTVV